MTKKDLLRAVSLYKRYKTDTAEFRKIADKYGLQVTDLTGRCWWAIKIWKETGKYVG